MDQQGEDNIYNNYSILSANLTDGSNKFKKFFRMSSPVQIQSYGNNNFVVEIKNNKKNKINDDDYIEKELKKSKKTKAYTTYTEISNEESLFFAAQNQASNQKYYQNNQNFITYYPDNIYEHSVYNNIQDNNNNQQFYKKEDIETLFYPSEKILLSNNINQNRNELKYQKFCSFFSKNPNSNNNSPKRKIFPKKVKANNNIKSERKNNILYKSKNQLEDFKIDKLKEIGDNFALRYLNRINQQKKINLQKNPYLNNINKIDANSDNKEKYDGIVNKIIMIEQKRKESKNRLNKLNLFNKTELQIGRKNSKNHIFEDNNNINNNNKIYEVRTLNEENENNFIKGKKFLKVNKNKIDQITLKNHSPSPITNKITVNNLLNRKIYNLKVNLNNSSNSEINNSKIKSIKDIKNSNYEKQEMLKTNVNNNIKKINYYIKNKSYINGIIKNQPNKIINTEIYDNTDRQFNNKTYTEVKIDRNVPKFRNKDRISVNRRLNMGKSRDKLNEKTKNINHKYLESVNIKNYKNTKKTEHSFNNVILPLK